MSQCSILLDVTIISIVCVCVRSCVRACFGVSVSVYNYNVCATWKLS